MVLRQRTHQLLVDIVVLAAGLAVIVVSWASSSIPLARGDALQDGLLAIVLIAGLILSHRYPMRIRGESSLNASPVPLFLMASLLPVPLAVTAIGLGELVGESMVRRRNARVSFVAAEAGRWILVGFAASLLAHVTPTSGTLQVLVLLGSSGVLWVGDSLTASLLSGNGRRQSPLRAIAEMAHEPALMDAALYLIGILGTLAAMRSTVAVLLVFFPAALAYRAFRQAMELDRNARQILSTVANASSDAVLLLDTRGHVLSSNRSAAALYSCGDVDSAVGMSVAELVIPQDRHRIEQDLRRALLGTKVRAAEYAALAASGTTFAVDIESLPALNRESGSGVVLCVMRDITEQKRAEKVHTHHALNDSLTGLPGRALLLDRLEQCLARARREGSPFAICLLDLNRLERINEMFGHRFGDLVLQQAGRRVRRALRDSDTVSRLGGDEFAVLLPAADEKGALLVATRLVKVLDEPYAVDDKMLEVTASMGIALYPKHGGDGAELMLHADAAIRTAKLSGNGYSFYETEPVSTPSNDSRSAEELRDLEPADHV